MTRRKRAFVIVAVLLALLIVLPCWSIYHQIEQARKDQALIAAIKDLDTRKALQLLNADVTKTLLEHGARIEAMDMDKDTALMFAVTSRSPETLRVLLEHGANVSHRDKYGLTALDRAKRYQASDELKIADLLRHYDAK